MKKTLLSIFVWLALTMAYGGGSLFAGGILNRGKTSQDRVVDVVNVAEVMDQDYPIRQNPNIKVAGGSVYALPAEPLSPAPERLPPPVYAIAGVKDVELEEGSPLIVDIVVILPEKESFSRGILDGADVSGWIENLPEGLEARAHGVKKGAKSIKLYVAGTPTVTAREVVRVNIPGTYLTGGTNRRFVSPTEQESFETWQKGQTE
jgi:hypothetical protein